MGENRYPGDPRDRPKMVGALCEGEKTVLIIRRDHRAARGPRARGKIIVARRSALGAPVICVFVIASDSCSPKARENNDGIWCRGAAENARNLRRVWNRFFVFRGQIGVRLLPPARGEKESERRPERGKTRSEERRRGKQRVCACVGARVHADTGLHVRACTGHTNTGTYAH